MNKQTTYSLLSIISLCLAPYAWIHNQIILGFLCMILGIILGIKSTDTKKAKWITGLLVAFIAIIFGYVLFLLSFRSAAV